jgi:lipopolysaccharide transport system ATP-binding protein
MSNTIIKVENLGKKFILNHQQQERYVAIRDVFSQKFKNLISRQNNIDQSKEEFWALKDINFEIKRGDSIGILGRNGAGKSTLLKILSRITEPTKGRIEIVGKMASLLEVGTGFHPELTGRENIFLNGAILGMKRTEIKSKFDEIVDFSGVEKFLDTPVKRYSSGMYVRLAFAVAANLESDILIVDEVLAVGDAEFQKKCLGKMDNVAKTEGRTVLFVSHNLASIKNLCNNSLLIKDGVVEMFDKTNDVINRYNSFSTQEDSNIKMNDSIQLNLVNSNKLIFEKITLPLHGDKTNFIINQESKLSFDLFFINNEVEINTRIGLFIINEDGVCINSAISDINYNSTLIKLVNGQNKIRINFENHHLMPGNYKIRVWVKSNTEKLFDYITDYPFIEINNNFLNYPAVLSMGSIHIPFKFEIKNHENN